MEFDPTSLGAVAVEEQFDPSSLGAVPVDDFDPTSIGAQPVEETKGASFGDLLRRIPAGIAEAGADVVSGLLKATSDAMGAFPKGAPTYEEDQPQYSSLKNFEREIVSQFEEKRSKLSAWDIEGQSRISGELAERVIPIQSALKKLEENPESAVSTAAQYMRDVSSRAQSDYGVDPDRREAFLSKVASGVGSLVPAMAAGPAAPIAVASMMGESGRKDAKSLGATPQQEDEAFYANSAVGLLSEALLGVPALIKSVRAAGIPQATAKSFAKKAALEGLKSATREGTQEGIEQAAQNAIAKYIAEYDKDRDLTQGVGESMLVGAVIGGPTGVVAAGGERLASMSESQVVRDTVDSASVVDEVLSETATATPPPTVEATEVQPVVPQEDQITPPETPAAAPTPTIEPQPPAETPEPVEETLPQPEENPTPEVPKAKQTPDERAKELQPFLKAAQAAAQASGATDPEDAAQVAWIKVSNSEKPLDNPRAVLIDAARSEAKSQLSKANAQKRGGGLVEGMDVADLESQAVQTRGPRAEVVSKEDMEGIAKAIGTLNENERRVAMVRARGEEMTAAEVAEELDLAEGTVRNIDMKLKELLKPYAKTMGFGQSLGPGAASAAEVLARYEKRKFAQRLEDSPNLDPDIKQAGNDYYEPVSERQSAETAKELIESRGEDAISQEITNPDNDLKFSERVAVGIDLLKRWNDQYQTLKESNPIQAKLVLDKAMDLNSWLKEFGTELGRAVDAFKLWDRVFTVEAMITAIEDSQGGSPLTPDQMREVLDLQEEIDSTTAKLSEEIEIAETEAAEEHADTVVAEMVGGQNDPVVQSLAEKFVAFMKRQSDAAWKRIQARKGRLNLDLTFGSAQLLDWTIIGASKLTELAFKGRVKKSEWVEAMKADYGTEEEFIGNEDLIWEESNKYQDEELAKITGNKAPKVKVRVKGLVGQKLRDAVTKQIESRVKDGDSLKDLRSLVNKLARGFIEMGITDRAGLVRALHGVVEPILPGTTEREVMDLLSGYGEFKQLSKDQTSVKLRDIKGQLQQVAKLQDIKEKKPLLASGLERRKKSDEEIRLEKEVNEAKRKYGVVITDPARQLKSAQDAIDTRIKNEIRAIAREIETGERPLDKTPAEWSEESKLRQATLDRLRETQKALHKKGLTEEERIKIQEKSLQKSIEEYERRIRTGGTGTTSTPRLDSPSLQALRAKRDALKAELDELRSSDELLQEQKTFDALARRYDELKEMLDSGNIDPETKEKIPDSELVAQMRLMVKQMSQRLADARKSSPQHKQAEIEKAIKATEKSIENLTKKIAAGDLSASKAQGKSSPELDKLKEYRKYLTDFLNQMRRDAKPKADPEQVALKSLYTRLTKQNAELQDKLTKGDFSKKPVKRLDYSKNEKIVAAHARNIELRKRFERMRMLNEKQNRTLGKRVVDAAWETANLPRNILSSGDFSAILRQGGMLAFSHPKLAAEAMNPMFKAFGSEQAFNDVQANLEQRNNYKDGVYKKAGLYLAETGDVKLSQKEEAIMSEWGDKIPGIKASNRAYVAFLNKMRADSFDLLYSQAEAMGDTSDATVEALGNYVNVATGRGNMGKFSSGAQLLSLALFSPRLMLSRIQLMLGQPLWKPLWTAATTGNTVPAKIIMKEYARSISAVATFSALAVAAGAEWEDEETSSDFLKLKFGNTRLDPWMGLIQPMVLFSRAFQGKVTKGDGSEVPIRGDDVPYKQERTFGLAAKFLRSKFNPTVGAGFNLADEQNVIGENVKVIEMKNLDVGGTKIPYPSGEIPNLFLPLSFRDMPDVMKENGFAKGSILSLLSIFGMGMQHYDNKLTSEEKALEVMASPR